MAQPPPLPWRRVVVPFNQVQLLLCFILLYIAVITPISEWYSDGRGGGNSSGVPDWGATAAILNRFPMRDTER